MNIVGCTKAPCTIKKGTDLTAEVLFTTVEATNGLKPQLFAKVFGVKMPINLPTEHQNVCAHLKEGQCPLKANQTALYHIQIPILKTYPSMKTEIEINLIGDGNRNHICFKIEGQVV